MALLNSDTEVPAGWLRRLAAQAYAEQRIASVSPFSNNATICGYPLRRGRAAAARPRTWHALMTCAAAGQCRAQRRQVPTTVGFCMYIRRAALDQVGVFDAEAFGRGYGEENDFCMRAGAARLAARLACDTFVYHEGAVSFRHGRCGPKQQGPGLVLAQRWPAYARRVERHVGPTRWRRIASR